LLSGGQRLGRDQIRREPQSLETALIKRGRELTATANCNCCHSMRGGKSFAGGRELSRALGTVLSSSIAPDGKSGFGRSCQETFPRAMRAARTCGDAQAHRGHDAAPDWSYVNLKSSF